MPIGKIDDGTSSQIPEKSSPFSKAKHRGHEFSIQSHLHSDGRMEKAAQSMEEITEGKPHKTEKGRVKIQKKTEVRPLKMLKSLIATLDRVVEKQITRLSKQKSSFLTNFEILKTQVKEFLSKIKEHKKVEKKLEILVVSPTIQQEIQKYEDKIFSTIDRLLQDLDELKISVGQTLEDQKKEDLSGADRLITKLEYLLKELEDIDKNEPVVEKKEALLEKPVEPEKPIATEKKKRGTLIPQDVNIAIMEARKKLQE
jgi:predicted transposase YbfD/YdcC